MPEYLFCKTFPYADRKPRVFFFKLRRYPSRADPVRSRTPPGPGPPIQEHSHTAKDQRLNDAFNSWSNVSYVIHVPRY